MLSTNPENLKRQVIAVPVLPFPELQWITATFSGSSNKLLNSKPYFSAIHTSLWQVQLINEWEEHGDPSSNSHSLIS